MSSDGASGSVFPRPRRSWTAFIGWTTKKKIAAATATNVIGVQHASVENLRR